MFTLVAATRIQSFQGSRFSTASWITSVLHTEPYPRKSDYPFFRGLLAAHARLSLLSPLGELFQRSIKYFCQQFHSCLLCLTIRETPLLSRSFSHRCRLCRRFCLGGNGHACPWRVFFFSFVPARLANARVVNNVTKRGWMVSRWRLPRSLSAVSRWNFRLNIAGSNDDRRTMRAVLSPMIPRVRGRRWKEIATKSCAGYRARREQREEKERVGGLFVKALYAATSLLQRGRSPSVSVRLTVNYNHDRCVTSIMATVAGWRSANSSERREPTIPIAVSFLSRWKTIRSSSSGIEKSTRWRSGIARPDRRWATSSPRDGVERWNRDRG